MVPEPTVGEDEEESLPPPPNPKLLIEACKNGVIPTVRELLEAGVDFEHRDVVGWTPLMWASVRGHPFSADLLLEAKAKHEVTSANGWTALTRACLHGYERVVRVLLRGKASPLVRDELSRTPLMEASAHGHAEVVAVLIAAASKSKAEVVAPGLSDSSLAVLLDARDANGWTSLMLACLHGHVDVAVALVAAGADEDIEDATGSFDAERLTRAGACPTELKDAIHSARKHAESERWGHTLSGANPSGAPVRDPGSGGSSDSGSEAVSEVGSQSPSQLAGDSAEPPADHSGEPLGTSPAPDSETVDPPAV